MSNESESDLKALLLQTINRLHELQLTVWAALEVSEMTDFEKEEFWKALGRLYDASVATREAAESLRKIAEAHEKRLDKIEVVH